MVGVNPQRRLIGSHRIGKPPLPGCGHAAVKPGPHIPRVVANGMVKVSLGLPWLTRLQIGQAAVEVGQQEGAIATNRFGVAAHSLEEAAPFDGGEPPPELRTGIVIGDRRGIGKVFGSDAEHSQMKPGDATSQQQLWIIGADRQPAGTEIDRPLEVALPPCLEGLLEKRCGFPLPS